MIFSKYVLDFLREAEDMSKIKNAFKMIEDKKLQKELLDNEDIFAIHKENSKTIEIIFNKENVNIIKNIAKKYGIPVFKDGTHEGINILCKKMSLKIRSTGKKLGSNNLAGAQKTIFTERATIMSIYEPLSNVKEFLKDYPEIYLSWIETFENTPKAIKKIIPDVNQFLCIHDETCKIYDNGKFDKGDGGFCDYIVKIAKMGGFSSKDAYCPADLWVVRKNKLNEYNKILKEIVSTPESAVERCNAFILSSYENGDLFPVSLKKLDKNFKIEIHKRTAVPVYKVGFAQVDMRMGPIGAMLGQLKYKNENPNAGGFIKFQMRAPTLGFTNIQFPFMSDGTKGSGKNAMEGKCPLKTMCEIMKSYGNYKTIPLAKDYFGAPKDGDYFSKITDSDIKEWWKMYSYCKTKSYVNDETPLNKIEDLYTLFNEAKTDGELAAKLCIKIQGLFCLYFLCKEDKHISDIISRMLNAAKKITGKNAFFIKIC